MGEFTQVASKMDAPLFGRFILDMSVLTNEKGSEERVSDFFAICGPSMTQITLTDPYERGDNKPNWDRVFLPPN